MEFSINTILEVQGCLDAEDVTARSWLCLLPSTTVVVYYCLPTVLGLLDSPSWKTVLKHDLTTS